MQSAIRLPIVTLALAMCFAPFAGAHADGLSRGAILSASCEGCHGTNGQSPGAIPPIAGKSVDYLVEALQGFRTGEREATVMGRHANGYDDDEIRLIAEYFATRELESGGKQ